MIVTINHFLGTIDSSKGKNVPIPQGCLFGEELSAAGVTSPSPKDTVFTEISTDTAIRVSDAYRLHRQSGEGVVAYPRYLPANSVAYLPSKKGQIFTIEEITA